MAAFAASCALTFTAALAAKTAPDAVPQQGDAAALPFADGTFDLVLSHEVIFSRERSLKGHFRSITTALGDYGLRQLRGESGHFGLLREVWPITRPMMAADPKQTPETHRHIMVVP